MAGDGIPDPAKIHEVEPSILNPDAPCGLEYGTLRWI